MALAQPEVSGATAGTFRTRPSLFARTDRISQSRLAEPPLKKAITYLGSYLNQNYFRSNTAGINEEEGFPDSADFKSGNL